MPKKLTNITHSTSTLATKHHALKRILPSINIDRSQVQRDTYTSTHKSNKRVKKKIPLTFNLLERIFISQQNLVKNKLIKICSSLSTAYSTKNFFLVPTEEQKKRYASRRHSHYYQKIQDLKIGEKIYFYETKRDSFKFVDKEKKYILAYKYITSIDKYHWKVTFYKNDPKKEVKYKDKESKVIIYKDKSQYLDFKNRAYYIKSSGERTLSATYRDGIKNKDISLAIDYCGDCAYPNDYLYIENKDNVKRGIFFNEKINGDNHTGIIAFKPQ